jgi:translation initiation factor IF-3
LKAFFNVQFYKDQGQILLLRLATDLEEFGKVEAMPVLEGKRMIMFIASRKEIFKAVSQKLTAKKNK